MSDSSTPESGKRSVHQSLLGDTALPIAPSAHPGDDHVPIDSWKPSTPVTIFEFLPSTKPWSTNDDRKIHHYERAARIKAWKVDTKLAYLAHVNHNNLERALPPGIVRLHIPFRDRRKRDPHNYCGTVLKAVIDGLVLAGAWPDDTPEWVGHREPLLYTSTTKKSTMCWVQIVHPNGWVIKDGKWRMHQ